jgi:hypothetical protein
MRLLLIKKRRVSELDAQNTNDFKMNSFKVFHEDEKYYSQLMWHTMKINKIFSFFLQIARNEDHFL